MEAENLDYLFTERHILIGLGSEVQIQIEGVTFRFKSTLIGMESDECLIIKTPMVPSDAPFTSIQHKLFPGIQIVVRYLYKGTVFGFQSKLIKAITTPLRLLFVEYPKIIENYDLRSEERTDCFLPTKIEIKNEEEHGAILDISERGCRCLIKALDGKILPYIEIDERITLRCQFPGIKDDQVISGNVKNFSRDNEEMILGIEFHEIAAGLKTIIDQYLSNIKQLS
jgi:c-di-GMP-binding flagellar brake protein YcgR